MNNAQRSSVRQLIQKIENHQIDMLFKNIYNRINQFNRFSPESKQVIRVTSNYVKYSRRNPKRSAKYVYHTGTLASFTARAGTSCETEEGRISNSSKYTMDLSVPEYVIKKGRPHGHRYGKNPGDKEYHDANQLKKCKKKYLQGIHDRFVRDPRIPSSND